MTENRKRNETLTVRLTKAEKNAIRSKAKRAKLNLTDYIIASSLQAQINVAGDVKPLIAELKRNHFGELLKKYGLRKIRFHDLRHTFASILLTKDVPLINVSNFLGHSDISTTANIYAHLDKASKQSSADIITAMFDENKE